MCPDGTYIRVSDHLPEHPKISAAGGEAGWLFVAGLCYCSRNLTDGFIPAAVVGRLTDLRRPTVLAGRLVETGLWHERGHTCPTCPPVAGGYLVHDYLAFQRSAAQVADIKAKRAAAGRAGGRAKAQAGHRAATPSDTVRAGATGVAGNLPAEWQPPATGPPLASATPQAESQADAYVPAVPQVPLPSPEQPPTPVSRRAREPGAGDVGVLDADGLVERVHRLRPDWTPARIRAAITHPDVAAHPPRVVAAAALRVAADPATRHPGRLRHPGPWWQQAATEATPTPAPPATSTLTRPPFDAETNARGRAAARQALSDRHADPRTSNARPPPDPGHRTGRP
ncbi:MAG TPA: hypothetical protein VFX70_20200 [Mycobacteriales bacterium]|nr:hypothetical protein [Mycobacteriales bacterium]